MVNYWSHIVQFLLPEKCLLCHQAPNQASATGLCKGCTESLPWLQNACLNCALPLNSPIATSYTCGQCQNEPPPFQQCHTLFHYQPPINSLISRLKFNQRLSYARTFGELMAQQILDRYTHAQLPDMIIPVPLHKRRLRKRGFNQAQEIARGCAAKLSLPLNTKQCQRTKHTAHQLGLSAVERRRNVKKAFTCKPFQRGLRVALVDDVMTTGTTLRELSLCLKNAGCEEVHLWCVARAHQ
jgi:ComF family protein